MTLAEHLLCEIYKFLTEKDRVVLSVEDVISEWKEKHERYLISRYYGFGKYYAHVNFTNEVIFVIDQELATIFSKDEAEVFVKRGDMKDLRPFQIEEEADV